jgi:uncharacterized protein
VSLRTTDKPRTNPGLCRWGRLGEDAARVKGCGSLFHDDTDESPAAPGPRPRKSTAKRPSDHLTTTAQRQVAFEIRFTHHNISIYCDLEETMLRIFQALTLIAAMTVMVVASTDMASAEGYGKQKVVYHINSDGGPESKAYKGALRNIQNHINAVGEENLDLKVVLHGNGLGVLMQAKSDKTLQTVVGSLKSQGVTFNVCNNTLKGRNINYEEDLYDVWEADIVPSGVAELAHLQAQGYTYIKP